MSPSARTVVGWSSAGRAITASIASAVGRRAPSWPATSGNPPRGPWPSRSGLLAIARTLTDVQLVDPTTNRALATLQAPEPQQISWLGFSPDGDPLALATLSDHVPPW